MRKRKIMVIEDEKTLLEVIGKKINSTEDLQAFLYDNGTDALADLKNHRILPDLIWLDYYLTDMEGLQFVQEINKDQALTNIPIFVISNSISHNKVHYMLALGVDNYLLKAEHQLSDIIYNIRSFLANMSSQ